MDDSLSVGLCSKAVELGQMAANVGYAEDAALDGVEHCGLRVHGGLALLRNGRGSAGVGGSRRGTGHRIVGWAKEGAEEMRSRMGTNNGSTALEPTIPLVQEI